MKKFSLMLMVISNTVFTNLGCDQGASPSIGRDIVRYSSIPRPFSDATYFIYGQNLSNGYQAVIDQLQSGGFAIREAWSPYDFGGCMMPIIDQMIVRLERPDIRIFSHGFVSDSSLVVLGNCIPNWKHYTFNK